MPDEYAEAKKKRGKPRFREVLNVRIVVRQLFLA